MTVETAESPADLEARIEPPEPPAKPAKPALSPETSQALHEALEAAQDATLDDLLAKPIRTSSFTITLPTADGGVRQVRLKFQALDGDAYDALVAAHPPKKKQRESGATWDSETFPPALIAAVSVIPKMTVEQARELYKSRNWAAGESLNLFSEAVAVCSRGLDVPFNAGD